MISCEHVQPQLFSICSFAEKNIVETNIEMTLPPNIPSLTLKGFKWLILRFLGPLGPLEQSLSVRRSVRRA